MELLACKLLRPLLLLTVFITLLNITAFSDGRATNFGINHHYAKNGEKDEFGETRNNIPFVDYTSQLVEPIYPYYGSLGLMYYSPAANSEVAAAGEDGLKGGLLFNGGNYGGAAGPYAGYGYGYGAPPYQGIFGLFPRGLLGFPRGLFGIPRGILGLPRIFFGYPVLPGGGAYGGIPAAPGGGYGTIPPGGGGYGGRLPGPGMKPGGGYGVRAHEVKKSKEVNPHP